MQMVANVGYAWQTLGMLFSAAFSEGKTARLSKGTSAEKERQIDVGEKRDKRERKGQ